MNEELKLRKSSGIVAAVVAIAILSAVLPALGSTVSDDNNGVISIAFDDTYQNQYDYAFPLLKSRGINATFYVITNNIREFSNDSSFMDAAELQALQGNGSEIASHSKTHPSFLDLSPAQISEECNASKQVLQSFGLNIVNFAYPYGYTNASVDSIVSQFYRSGRSAYSPPYVMPLSYSHFNLTGFPGDTAGSYVLENLKNIIDQVYSTNGWAIVFFNNVLPYNTTDPHAISINDFSSFLDYVGSKGIRTLTVNQALDLGAVPSSPSPPVFSSSNPGNTWYSSSPGLVSSPAPSSSSSPSNYPSASSFSPSPVPSSLPSSSPLLPSDQTVPSVSPSSEPSLSPSLSPAKTDQAVSYYLHGMIALLLIVPLLSGGLVLYRKRKKSQDGKRNLLVSERKKSK